MTVRDFASAARDLALLPITLDSPYLEIGDYSSAAWQGTFAANSPLRNDLVAIRRASRGGGILAREQALKESSDGTDRSARRTPTPLGLMVRSNSEPPNAAEVALPQDRDSEWVQPATMGEPARHRGATICSNSILRMEEA